MEASDSDNTTKPKKVKVAPKKLKAGEEKKKVKPDRSIEEKEQLIGEVCKYQSIWKTDEETFHNRDSKRVAWEAVSSATLIEVEECKAVWKNLRDSFPAKLKKSKTGKSVDGLSDVAEAEKARKWHFFDQMLFLKDTFVPRRTESNFEIMDRGLDSSEPSTDFDMNDYSAGESPEVPMVRGNRKRGAEVLISQIGKHMDIVGKALSESQSQPNTMVDPFIGYLAKTLAAVPDDMKRKCEQNILHVANIYADGFGNSLEISYTQG